MAKKKSGLTYAIEQQDCVAGLKALPKGSVHLAVADPPYNQKMEYADYDDNKSRDEYLAWTREWLAAAAHALHKHGALWIFVPDEWVSELDLMARKEFKFTKQQHVVWAFTFGQAQQKRFTRSHCHVLWLSRTKTAFTFDDEAVRVPSARQLVYNDKRANAAGKQPDDTWMLLKEQLEPYMTPDRDVWLENRICGTYKERRKHSPNQIPIPIMERIVRTTSRPGELVADLFAGTGGLADACRAAGRSYLGFEISKTCVAAIRERLAAPLPEPAPAPKLKVRRRA